MRKYLHILLNLILISTLLSVIQIAAPQSASAAATDKCDGSSTQNTFKVTATHGKVFYIDSGQNQNVDAAYVGYQITSSVAQTNVWAHLDNFTGGVVTLANPADESLSLGNITGSTDTKTAFFLLKAPTSSSNAQSHVVHIFLGKPDTTGAQERYTCTFTFTKVAETIKAAANKVNSITPSVSSYVLGSTMTVVVNGDCGTVGQGTSLDADMIWVSPAARSSWPTSALRLVGTRLKIDDVSNLNSPFIDKTDILQVKNLRTLIGGNPYKCYYEATYTFKIVGSTAAAISLSPIAQISSGTQIKHTDMTSIPSSSLTTNSVTISATVSKSVATATTQTSGKTNINYTLTLANQNASNSVTFDEVIDTPDSGLTYVAGTVRLAGAATAEPVVDSAGRLIFSQPITVPASSSRAITYTMQEVSACSNGGSISYTNSAVGKVGSISIGSSSTTYSVTRAAGTCGTSNLTDTTTTTTSFAVEAVTYPASSITNSGATLNGTVDPNSLSGQTITFQYGTSASLSTFTSVNLVATTTNATTPYGVSTNITGLSSGTTYYFRIKVGSVYGSILNFVTTEPVGNPTATTTNVSSVTLSGSTYTVTFNGTIDPNQVLNGAGAKFEYAIDSSVAKDCTNLGSTSSTIVYELDDTGAPTATALNLTGAFPVDVFATQTGLTRSVYYCYRTVATYSTSSTANGAWVSFYTGTFNNQTITFNQIADTTTSATVTLNATASSGLTVSYTSNTPSVCTISGATIVFLTGGTCSITARQPGNFEYYPAEPVTINFQVTAPTRTITFNSNTGSGTMASQSANIPTALNANRFTKEGNTFLGWSTTSGGSVEYNDQQEYNFTSDQTFYAIWSPNTYTITYKAGTGGTGDDVQQSFTFGGSATLYTNSTTAFTNSGKVVTGWNEAANGSGTSRAFSSTYSAAANLIIYAQWATQYTVTFNDNYSSPAQTTTQTSHVAANLTANPWSRTGYTFGGWASSSANATAGTVAYANSASYPFTSSTTLYAIWTINTWNFAYDSNTATSGSAPSGGGVKDYNSLITVASNTYTKTDHRFNKWTTAQNGSGTSYNPSNTFNMPNQNVTLYAQWTRVYTVTIGTLTNGGTSSISVTTSPAAAGETVTLTVSAQSGLRIVAGTLTATYGSDTATITGSGPYEFVMPAANVVITATFESIPAGNFTLNLSVGAGGTVSAGSGAISLCTSSSGTCSGSYTSASSVTLTATPASGYVISSWGGVCSGSTNTCTVYMDNDKNASITFIATYTITLTPTTSGGSVGSSPSGISSCSTANVACVATYNSGTTVTLTSTPNANYVINSWTGNCSGSSSTCTLTMNGNKTAGISYSATYTVTIGTLTNGGSSSISVATSPSVSGATITLTVSAEAGKQLKSGTLTASYGATTAAITSSAPYTFTMPADNVVVTAEFEAVPAGTYSITVNPSTGGSGSTSNATVSSGGSVTLTATPSSGYTFTSWTCTGGGTLVSSTANPATLSNITANATCTPNFTANSSGPSAGPSNQPRGRQIVVTRITNNPNRPSANQAPSVPTVITGTNSTFTPGNATNQTNSINSNAKANTGTAGGVVAALTNDGSEISAAKNNASVVANNTNASTQLVVDPNVPASVNVKRSEKDNSLQVSAVNGWTGRVSVAVVDESLENPIESFVEVVIAPIPVTAPKIILPVDNPPATPQPTPTPKPFEPNLTITWNPSPSQVTEYIVKVNSKQVCVTTETSCDVKELIGPKSKVEVVAAGNDNTFSNPTRIPAFKPSRPVPALVVNFATASSVLTPKFKADLRALAKVMVREGFTKVNIAGHTDTAGRITNYDNQKLSEARSKVTMAYLKRFVPKLVADTGAYAYERLAADESTPEGMYTNRRAEVAVW